MNQHLEQTHKLRHQAPELHPITFSGGLKSISDDDLCATCQNCQYEPGDLSGCTKRWPGHEDADGYVQVCAEFDGTP